MKHNQSTNTMKHKPPFKRLAAAAATLALIAIPANAAVLIAGTEIGVDFGPTAPTNFFNTVNPDPAAGGSISAGNVIDTSNATVDGVGFSWASASGFFNNNDAISLAGQPAVFNESNLTDWIGISGDQNVQGFITLTFTGLDDSLTYDLVVGAGFASAISDVLWTADSQSATTDSSVGANSFVTLSGLSTDGSGNLVIVGAGTGGAGNRQDIVVVSALHLTAIPEPSAALLGGLGLLALLRRRR
jgi:hypothetical protein